jgi:hypothetical protein
MVEPSAPTILPAVDTLCLSGTGLRSATSGFTHEAIPQVGSKLDMWSAPG